MRRPSISISRSAARGSEGHVQDLDRSTEFVVGDGQGRTQADHVPTSDLETQAKIQRRVQDGVRECDVRRAIGRSQLDAKERPEVAHGGNRGMPPLERFEKRAALLPQRLGAADQAFPLDDGDDGERGGAAERALLVRVVADRRVPGDVEVAPRDERGEGHDPSAEALAEDHHVRDAADLLESEEAAATAKRRGDLVEDEERAVAVAARRTFGQNPGGGGSTVVQRIGSAMTAATSPCTSST